MDELGSHGSLRGGMGRELQAVPRVEQAVDAVAHLEQAALLLVGDGPERSRIEQPGSRAGRARRRHRDGGAERTAAYLRAMDAASGAGARGSPVPLLAPEAGRVPGRCGAGGGTSGRSALPSRLSDGVDAMLVPPNERERSWPPCAGCNTTPTWCSHRSCRTTGGQRRAGRGTHQVRRCPRCPAGLMRLPGRATPTEAHSATVPVSGRAVRCRPTGGRGAPGVDGPAGN